MLAAVPAGGDYPGGRICDRVPKQLESVVVALAVLCGRPLSDSILHQFAAAGSKMARDSLRRGAKLRCTQLSKLEAALACMTVAEQRKHRADAAKAVGARLPAAAAAAAPATAPSAGQRRQREDSEPEDDEEPDGPIT